MTHARHHARDFRLDDDHVPIPPRRYQEPRVLLWRHRLMARLMVHGSSDPGLLAFIERWDRVKEGRKSVAHPAPPPAPGEPLPADEAGRLAGLRKGYSRALAETTIFKKQLAEERKSLGSAPENAVDPE